jgi:hypothetical protein
MTDLDELLRRDGEAWRATATTPPRVNWSALPSRRRTPNLSWLVAATTAAVVVALAILVPTWLDRGTSGRAPAYRPSPSSSSAPTPPGGPASFIALDHAGVTQVDALTGESRGMTVSEAGRHPTALAVADDGNVGYATYSETGCRVNVLRYRWTSRTGAQAIDAAKVDGVKVEAVAVSPDGHLLALSVLPCNGNGDVDDLLVVDLESHQQRRWTGYHDVSGLGALQWGPDNQTLSYIVNPCCGGGTEGPRLLNTSAPGTSYVKPRALSVPEEIGRGVVLWFGDQLAVVMDTEIRSLSRSGQVGAVLARGLPNDVAMVDTDRTGRHLLLTTQTNKLYRWDDGVLTPLAGAWVGAGW